MAKQAKRVTRRDKMAAAKVAADAERKALTNAVAALGDRVAVVEAASGIIREEAPKGRPGRDFIGQKKDAKE